MTIIVCGAADVLGDACPECGGWLSRVRKGGFPDPGSLNVCDEDCIASAQATRAATSRGRHLELRDLLCDCAEICAPAGRPTDAERAEWAAYCAIPSPPAGYTLHRTDRGRWTAVAGTGDTAGEVTCQRNPRGLLDLSWATDEHHHRRGIAYWLTATAVSDLYADHPGEPVTALIRPWNTASLALARKLGMRETGRDNENVTMQLEVTPVD